MTQRPAPPDEATSAHALLFWAVQLFESKGIETARLDAELLLAHALGWRRLELYARGDEALSPDACGRFAELAHARGERVPAKYLLGEAEFFSLPLAVDSRVLVPRPETELLVERALELLPEDGPAPVADLGTGSGAIAIAVGAQRAAASIVATDVSPDALEVARANAERHGLGGRIEFRLGDWFAALDPRARFDAILSNPPYVATADLEAAMPEVREHEPRLALEGGPDGLACLRRLVAGGASWLRPGGWLIVEIGAGQRPAVEALAEAAGTYETIDVKPDYQGMPRVVSMQTDR